MRGFLINKNLCLYHWLKKKIGKKCALGMANAIEKTLLIFGREVMPISTETERLPKSSNKWSVLERYELPLHWGKSNLLKYQENILMKTLRVR